MNRTLAENLRRTLMPALEASHGFQATYTRAGGNRALTVIPAAPDWAREDEGKTVIEEWVEMLFLVAAETWARTGFGTPQQGDKLTVTLADGVQRTYGLLARKGTRPYDMDATASHYALRMKWIHP